MRDLLDVSPNAAYATMLSSWDAVTMRHLCLKRLRMEEWFGASKPIHEAQSRDFRTYPLLPSCQGDVLDCRVLPGIPFILVSSSSGSIHIVSTDSGVGVATWRCRQNLKEPLNDLTLNICQSYRHGTLILALGSFEDDEG
jgi:hypothetical protein